MKTEPRFGPDPFLTSNPFLTNTWPVTLFEMGHAHADREGRNWYLVDAYGLIGITPKPEEGAEVMSTYEPED